MTTTPVSDDTRNRIIEAIRSLLREKLEVSRKAVAERAGVTPSDVSKFFPDFDPQQPFVEV